MKKEPPHLVMAKQPTIVQKDPFKTEKIETALGTVFEKYISKYRDTLISALKREIGKRELESKNITIAKTVTGIDWETDELLDDSLSFAEDGYIKGIQVASQQLKPLSVITSINPANKVPKATLDKIREANEQYIDELADRFGKLIYDTVYDGLESGKPLSEIIDEIVAVTDKSIVDAKRMASDIIIDAARKGEVDTYREAGISLYRGIAVIDTRTCDLCLALNGRIYEPPVDENGLINFDSGEFLVDEIGTISSEAGLGDWIDPSEGMNGPPYHPACRCHFAPVMTFDEYKGSVQKVVSEV